MDNEELIFNTEWLALEKYHFKILTMIVVLADNKRAFRGKLSDLCKELSIQTSTVNLQKLKTTLAVLISIRKLSRLQVSLGTLIINTRLN